MTLTFTLIQSQELSCSFILQNLLLEPIILGKINSEFGQLLKLIVLFWVIMDLILKLHDICVHKSFF